MEEDGGGAADAVRPASEELAERWDELNRLIDAHLEELRRR
ncbi:hypothetical protein [Streptomyces radicis]|nr:hypothetical protein [Streptomyces radicis]